MSAACKYNFRARKRKSCEPPHVSSAETANIHLNMDMNLETQSITTRPSKKRKLLPDTTSVASTSSHSNCNYIEFDIRSWAWMDRSPFRSHIKLSNNRTESRALKTFDIQKRRGHRVVVIDGVTGDVEQSLVFDTWGDIYAGVRFKIFLKTLQFRANKWVVIIAHDSAYNICTEAVFDELEKWGAMRQNRALHREAYVLILSSNRQEKWWQHVTDARGYFDKKYTQTMRSWNKRKSKSKPVTCCQHDDTVGMDDVISKAQCAVLSSFGGCNVFFERKTAEKKGPILLKGFLPKMKPVPITMDRIYRTLTPHERALKAGIEPCDGDTRNFYCASCLDTADARHMVVCRDASHGKDESCECVRKKAMDEYVLENFETAWDYEEDERMTKMRHCGQAFHVYCAPYPDTIWRRWCSFMQVCADDEWSVPDFVALNIKKYQQRWIAMQTGQTVGDHACASMDGKETSVERALHAKKEETRQYYQRNLRKFGELKQKMADLPESDETSIETGLGLNPYDEIYAQEFTSCVDSADLSQWQCRFHHTRKPTTQQGQRHFCGCGKPMVQQLCGNADGEVDTDLRDGFQGLWCNGCDSKIASHQTVFRCIMGARCPATDDGNEYCVQCMLAMVAHAQPQIRCLCGDTLLLGTVHDMKQVFHAAADDSVGDDECSSQRRIKKTSSYRCAWCLHKFSHKQDALYYCARQTQSCLRVLRKHLLRLQPFVVCVACALQTEDMTQQCSCGSNLHCRLLADWMYNDRVCYDQNRLQSAPPVPNTFRASHSKHKNSHSKPKHNNREESSAAAAACSSESAYDFYVQRRCNDDEDQFYDEQSRKYVQCASCATVINAYQFVFICNHREAHPHDGTHYLCAACAVQQRPQNTALFPDRDEHVEICILFVAHDGIAQSQLWRQWLAENAEMASKIGISVQCNNYETLKHGREFAEEYRIDVQRPTEWGKLTVPLTIQKSLQLSLRRFPKCRRFYVVSGREIPLVSAQHLYAMPDKTQLMAKKITKKTATKLRKTRLGKLVQFYSHHAAMCLSRTHVEIISTAPWKEYFAESDHIYEHVGAPDEFIVGTTLHAMGVDMRRDVWREVTTDFEIPTIKRVRHPINWESLHAPVEFWRVSDTLEIQGKERKCLKQLLVERYGDASKLWGYGPCFFRKVSASVKFGSFVPWKLCTLKPPIVDHEKGIDETLQYRADVDATAYMDLDEIQETTMIE